MGTLISGYLVDRYAAGPSSARIATVKGLHENIRAALAAAEGSYFETFLQGSYRNDTAIADINDVDIVALYTPWRSPVAHSEWLRLFNRVATVLQVSPRVGGTVSIGDKCVKITGVVKADVVPAVRGASSSSYDPITIYSSANASERPNFPRTHYSNGVAKQASTWDAYKATVRLFKRWVRQYPKLTAPSFYIECTVHSVPSSKFDSYLPESFAGVASAILNYTRQSVIYSVAGDKDILVAEEWHPDHFEAFQEHLRADLKIVRSAMQATTQSEADRLWKLAFGD